MRYKYSILVIAIIGFQFTTNAQSSTPGGVESPIFWFITVKDNNGKSIWKDDDNSRKAIVMAQKSTSKNINFHDAYPFDAMQEVVLHNTKINQLTVLGAFYPEYNSSLKLVSDLFYSVLYNDTPIYKFTSTTVNFDKSNISENFILPYNGNFKITSNSELNKSMKIGSYTCSRLSNNLNNPWGEECETKIKFNFKGYIPEFIFYGRVLTIKELNRIHSYLAIKYGLTLDMDYYNSNDDIIWNPIINKKFHNRVSAIGKDIIGAINQPKSNTTYEELYSFSYDADSGNRSVTIGFKENEYQNLSDKKFLFWGDDAGSIKRNDLFEINTAYPQLFATKRKWMMQNEGLINLPTIISIGNPLLEELNAKVNVPCYYLLLDDGQLDLQDIFPFNNKNLENFKWSLSNTNFKFGVAEKLRYMVKQATDQMSENGSGCDGITEKNNNTNIEDIRFKNGVYYYRNGGILTNCRNRILYKYSKTDKKLIFYTEGGIGKYRYTIKDSANLIIKVDTIEPMENKEYTISPIDLTKQKKYNLIITDETNQTIELILAIK